METNSFDAIYQNAPRHQVDELLEFRSTHPVRQRSIDGVDWKYILSGRGSETILIMGGPLSTPEMPYRSILNLEQAIESSAILIIETQDEESLDRSEQKAFRQTYPNAHIHLLESGGHLREITHKDEYPAIVREFITRSID
jgi:hypothetical protein